jgi:uncharacterized protein (TIGR03437 family)
MKSFLKLCALGAFVVVTAAAQPKVTALVNNYGNVLPGLPNYGIAQGSIFIIYGSGLANTTTTLQSVPLQTTLSGVTINVTVSGSTVACPIYFLSPGQIDAILPSSTPVGTGTITVTNNGTASATAPIKVVQSAFGLLTLNGAGSGPAAVFNANNGNAYLGATAAANAGDTITLWGTGLGPATGDETKVQVQTDLTNIPIEVDIGGVKAAVAYHGRSQFPALDQINVVVPAGVTGCSVSVVVVTGSYVSNFSTIPVATTGRVCSDVVTTGVTNSALQTLLAKGTFSLGFVNVSKTTTVSAPITIGGTTIGGNSTTDGGSAEFFKYTNAQFAATSAFGQQASIGSCVVYTYSGSSGTIPNPVIPTQLNAGPSINVNGPNGTKSMPFQSGLYFAVLGGGSGASALPIFIPDSGGTFKFDNGSGGPDVGAFTAQISLAAPLVWSNIDSISTIQRTQGVDVNWTGGDANTYAQITGASIQTSPALGGIFICSAPVSAHTFHVPSAVLLALPPSTVISAGGINISTSSLSVGNYTNPIQFNAPGVDLAFVSASATSTKSGVVFQ